MANETTVQTPCVQENHESDECRENIPPEATTAAGTSNFKDQVGDVVEYSSTQPSGENEPLSHTCTFSTPAPPSSNGGVKAKSRLSGLQSALTPILKYLNIGNKCPSPEPLKHGNSPQLTVPGADCHKSSGSVSKHTNSHFSTSHGNTPVCWLDDECLPEITLLDVTCDSTVHLTKNDSALPDSVPGTPVIARPVKNTFTNLQLSRLNASINLNAIAQSDQATSVSKNTTETSLVMNQCSSAGKASGSCDGQDVTFDRQSRQRSSGNTCNDTFNTKPHSKQNGTITVPETNNIDSHQTAMGKLSPPTVCNAKVHPSELSKYKGTPSGKDLNAKMVDIPESIDAPLRWLDDRYFPEITLLDVTRDSEFSPRGEMSSLDVTQDISPVGSLENNTPSSALSGQIVAESGTLDTIQSEDLSSTLDGNVTHTINSFSEQADKCVGENIPKASLEVTRDISMGSVLEDSRPSLECSGQNMVNIQTSAEDALATHPANVTHDISSSSDMSVQCAVSDVQCDTSSTNVSSELQNEPVVSSNTVEANNEELLTSTDAELTSKVPQPSLKTAANDTFTIAEQSNLSASTNVNTTAQMPCPQNRTLDLPPSNVNSPKAKSDAKDQVEICPQNRTLDLPPSNVNSSKAESDAKGQVEICPQNRTLDLPPSNVNSSKAECDAKGQVEICPQNRTLDLPSSSINSPKAEGDAKDQATSVFKSTSKTSRVTNQNCSAVRSSGSCDVQNVTFDRHSLRKSTGNIVLEDDGATTFSLQSNTFDSKLPLKQNATITVSETSSSENHVFDTKSPSKQNGTITVSETSSTKNSTFDTKSYSKQNGTITVSEKSSSENNTFDTKSPSKQNGTITVSETSSSNTHQSTLDQPSPSNVCNATSSPKESNSEVLPKHSGTTANTDSDAKMVDNPESTFEANPAVEVASGASRPETKDHSQSGLPTRDCLSDIFVHQSMDVEDNKANTLNLDDTLDLRADSLITSTPMPNCKVFNFHVERQEGKVMAAQKKLYGDGPSKPDGQAPSDVPSNIVCDRKTFLTQPAAKSLLPPLKPPSKLLKFKPASTLPGKFELMTSGLPMTRQRTQAEALRNTAASDAPQATTGISTSYNLRATTSGSKPPNPGLRKPALSGIPSGIQRAAPGLRPPSARSTAPASSSTDKPRGPTATSPAAKSFQAKKHPLTRGEALPTAKRKKTDAPLPSGSAEASSSDAANQAKNLKRPATSHRAVPAKTQRDDAAVPASTAETSTSCNAVGRGRALKQPVTSHRALPPKPQGHGCAKCAVLEQQLEMKSEEIRRLKEELLKYKKQGEES